MAVDWTATSVCSDHASQSPLAMRWVDTSPVQAPRASKLFYASHCVPLLLMSRNIALRRREILNLSLFYYPFKLSNHLREYALPRWPRRSPRQRKAERVSDLWVKGTYVYNTRVCDWRLITQQPCPRFHQHTRIASTSVQLCGRCVCVGSLARGVHVDTISQTGGIS